MFSLLLALTLSGPAQAKDEPAAATDDSRLFADYERVVEFLKKTPAYAVDVRLERKGEGEDAEPAQAARFTFRIERPGKFRLEIRTEGKTEPIWMAASDGTTVTTYFRPRGVYMQEPLTSVVEALDGNSVMAQALSGSLIDTVLRPDLVEIVKERVKGVTLAGTETVDGKDLRHYRFKWRGDDEEIWIGPDAEPLIRKLIRIQRMPEAGGKEFRIVTTTTLSWTIGGPPSAPGTYTLDLPGTARKVEDLTDALSEPEEEKPAQPPGTGKP